MLALNTQYCNCARFSQYINTQRKKFIIRNKAGRCVICTNTNQNDYKHCKRIKCKLCKIQIQHISHNRHKISADIIRGFRKERNADNKRHYRNKLNFFPILTLALIYLDYHQNEENHRHSLKQIVKNTCVRRHL